MGVIGQQLGSLLGQKAGQAIGGKKYGNVLGDVGKILGSAGGAYLSPFKNGGRVPGKVNAPKKILAHGGEYILPVGVKPTVAQQNAVAKRKLAAKKAREAKKKHMM